MSGALRRTLAALAALGLLFALPPLMARVRRAAPTYRNVEVAWDLAAFRAAGIGAGPLRRDGATAVFLREQTVGDLEAEGLVTLQPFPGGTRLLAPPDVAAWLRTRLPSWPVVAAPRSLLRGRRVGFWRGDLAALARDGLAIDARVYDVRALSDLRGFPVHAVWFAGTRLGVPAGAAAAMRGLPLGVAEGPEQLGNVPKKGLPRLFAALGRRAVRVFDPAPVLYARNTPRDTELETLRAAVGRNVRVIVVHPVATATRAANAAMVGATLRLLRAHGFHIGRPVPLPPLRVPLWARAGMALGAAAAVALLADLLGAGRAAWALGALSLAEPSVAAALAFPGLALYLLARRSGAGGLLAGWVDAVLAAAISLAGGLYVSGLLANQAHIMEWALFHGVKLLLVGPPALAVLACFANGLWATPERLAATRIRVWHMALLLALVLVGFVYIARSGNAGASLAPGIEVQMRDWFTAHLPARPREKEFLLGWPLVVMAAFAVSRRARAWFGALIVGGSVATASVVDTFAHVRTALPTSLARTGLGLLFGLALGTAGYAVLWAISRYSDRYRSPIASRVKD